MNTELFAGNPTELQERLVALIAGAATNIDQIFLTHVRGEYIIVWS